MSTSNRAAFLDGDGIPLRLASAPMPAPEPNRILIRNRYLAINPADWKVQDKGVFIRNYPVVLGGDVAGEVLAVGDNITHFQPGDRVMAHLDNLATQKIEHGGFALYTSAPACTAAKVPDGVELVDACVLPLAFDTAAVGLYSPAEEGYLGLPMPVAGGMVEWCGKTIVVWGGSSSVGAIATQLAVASGVKVVATASERNFDFCKKCGAAEVIDYKSPSVVEEVVTAVQSLGGTFTGAYDAISIQDQSYDYLLPILEELGGGNLATVLPNPRDVPNTVKCGNVMCISPLTHPLWREYITPALESGLLKCLPEPTVIGKGLESVQAGLNASKKGVSARKVVVEL